MGVVGNTYGQTRIIKAKTSGSSKDSHLLAMFNQESTGSYTGGEIFMDNYPPSGFIIHDVSSSSFYEGKMLLVATYQYTSTTSQTLTLYKNGTQTFTDSGSDISSTTRTFQEYQIAGDESATQGGFQNSKFYAAAMWDRVLTSSEIAELSIDLLVSRNTVFLSGNPHQVPSPSANGGRILQANSAGTGLVYGTDLTFDSSSGLLSAPVLRATNKPFFYYTLGSSSSTFGTENASYDIAYRSPLPIFKIGGPWNPVTSETTDTDDSIKTTQNFTITMDNTISGWSSNMKYMKITVPYTGVYVFHMQGDIVNSGTNSTSDWQGWGFFGTLKVQQPLD